MKIKWHILALMALTGFSGIASSKAITGKIIINNQTYSSGLSNSTRGSGQAVINKRKLDAFNKLYISTTVDIEYFASKSYRLELTADDNIVPIITSTIKGDTLSIDASQSYSTQSKLRAKIYGPSILQKITVDGSSDVNLQGITGDLLEINLDGTGDITVQGKVPNLIIKVDGSGDVNTKELVADNVTINLEGPTDIIVTANENLDVVIDGTSDVTYYGHPGSINKIIDGTGNILAGD